MLTFQFAVFVIDSYVQVKNYTTFFMSMTAMIRIQQVADSQADAVLLLGLSVVNIACLKWTSPHLYDYSVSLLFHALSVYFGKTILTIRTRVCYRYWDQCHLFLILQKKTEERKRLILELSVMHGIPEQSRYLHGREKHLEPAVTTTATAADGDDDDANANADDNDDEKHGGESEGSIQSSVVFKELAESSACQLEVEVVKNALMKNMLFNYEELPEKYRSVKIGEIDPDFTNLRIKFSIVIGIRVQDFNASTSTRSMASSANDFNKSYSNCFPETAIKSVIDDIAGKYNVTFVRRFGDIWIGILGFFDNQNGERRDLLYRNAMQMCCDVNHIAKINHMTVSCAIDAGQILGGFLSSACFDLFGTEIRWVLLQLSSPQKGGICCSVAFSSAYMDFIGNNSSSLSKESAFVLDFHPSLVLKVRASDPEQRDALSGHYEVDNEIKDESKEMESGTKEDLVATVVNAIECSGLSQTDIKKYNEIITYPERHVPDFLSLFYKRESKERNKCSKPKNVQSTQEFRVTEADVGFFINSSNIIGISITDTVLEMYSDDDLANMHTELDTQLQKLAWTTVFKRSYLWKYFMGYTPFVDDYEYDSVKEEENYYWRSFLDGVKFGTTEEEVDESVYYDPLESSQYPIASISSAYAFFRSSWKQSLALIGQMPLWDNAKRNFSKLMTLQSQKQNSYSRYRPRVFTHLEGIKSTDFLVYPRREGGIFPRLSSSNDSLSHFTSDGEDPSTAKHADIDSGDRPLMHNSGQAPKADTKSTGGVKTPAAAAAAGPKWGTKISFKKYYHDSKMPYLFSSMNYLFVIVCHLGMFYIMVILKASPSADNGRYGTEFLLGGSIVCHITILSNIERRYDKYSMFLSSLTKAFYYFKYPVIKNSSMEAFATESPWWQFTFEKFGDVDLELRFLIMAAISVPQYLYIPKLPLVDIVVYVLGRIGRYSWDGFLTRGAVSVILWFLMFSMLSIALEDIILRSYLVEHKLMPFGLKVSEKYSKKMDQEMNHYMTKNHELDDDASALVPHLYHTRTYNDCVVIALCIKASEILPSCVEPEHFGRFMGEVMNLVYESVQESGLTLINECSGVSILASLNLSSNIDDGTNEYSNSLASPFEFMRSFERKISDFMSRNLCSVDWSIGIGFGSVSLGMFHGKWGNFDVVGSVRDFAFICSVAEDFGNIYSTRAFHDAAVRHNSFPYGITIHPITLEMGKNNKIDFYKFQKSSFGMTLNDFEYEGFLDSGGFGSVHLARERHTSVQYAIKVVQFSKRQTMENRRTILTEFNVIHDMHHKNIVSYKHCVMNSSRVYFVMTCIRGGNLKQVVEKYTPHLDVLLLWYVELVLALEYIHKRMIIHRDVKPANCLIGTDGHLRLTDFGLSIAMISDGMNSLSRSLSDNDMSSRIHSKFDEQDSNDGYKIISKLLPLDRKRYVPVSTVLVAARKRAASKAAEEMRALSYVCFESDSAENAKERLSAVGVIDIILIDITRDEALSALAVANGDSTTDTCSGVDNIVSEMLNVVQSISPMVPVLILVPIPDVCDILRTYYRKMYRNIMSLMLIQAPLRKAENIESLAIAANKGRASNMLSLKAKSSAPLKAQEFDKNESFDGYRTDIDGVGIYDGSNVDNDFSYTNGDSMNNSNSKSNSATTLRSTGPVGTTNFISPELIQHEAYGPGVDWWACGVTMYECTTRAKLFKAGHNFDVFKDIVQGELKLSALTEVCVEQAKIQPNADKMLCYGMQLEEAIDGRKISNIESLVTGLLQRNPAKRLGNGGPNEIKSHPFYGDVQWDTMNITDPTFKPATLPAIEFPQRNGKVVYYRRGKRIKSSAINLFYEGLKDTESASGRTTQMASLPKYGRNRYRNSARSVSKKLSMEKYKFSNLSHMRQAWLSRWPEMGSSPSPYFSREKQVDGNFGSRNAGGRLPLIEEGGDSAYSFGASMNTGTRDSATDFSFTFTATQTSSNSPSHNLSVGAKERIGSSASTSQVVSASIEAKEGAAAGTAASN
jgi:serine/threonine protein kinase